MTIIILFLHGASKNDHFPVSTSREAIIHYYEQVAFYSGNKLTIIQRSDIDDKIRMKNTTFILHRDNFPRQLSWWQETKELFLTIASLNPVIIHLVGLNLPLHFRWLRKQVGEASYILGQYTGEQIWPNLKIWLQQFGLRVVDGFLFEDQKAADLWLKQAVILPKQDLFKIKNLHREPQSLAQVYSDILKKDRS